jgi:hypothetical protein
MVLDATPSMTGTIDDSWAKAATLKLETDFTYRRSTAICRRSPHFF